jgi:hypothetical protein
MFNLSGAINVLLFLIARPQLLLFPRPEKLGGPEIELGPHGNGAQEPTTTSLADGSSRHSTALNRISSNKSDYDV